MKSLIYLFMVGVIGLLPACQDVTVGYLIVDETAGYSQDTLHIFNINKEIKRLNDLQIAFKEATTEQQDELDRLQIELKEGQKAADDFYNTNIGPLESQMDDPNFDWDNYFALYDQWDQEYNAPLYELDAQIQAINEQLSEIAEKMGLEAPEVVSKKLKEYQNKIDFKLPWVTPKIDGVLGTEPLTYSILSIKNENAENAAKFMSYAGAMGGGMLYVNIDVDVPVGYYTVTLEVRNEGRTQILEDVFTFAVDAEDKSELPEEEA